MTKNFSNFTSSTNKTKKKNVKNESENTEKLIDLSMEDFQNMEDQDFQNMLEQVTDFSIPESKKSPLVQKLNQQHAKEDNCLEAAMLEKSEKSSGNKLNKNLNKKSSKLTQVNLSLVGETKSDLQTPVNESPLQELNNFVKIFDKSCLSVNSSLTNSMLSNCNLTNWDPTIRNSNQQTSNTATTKPANTSKLNGTLTSNLESSSSSNHLLSSTNKLTNPLSSESSQQQIRIDPNSHYQLQDNLKKCCDNFNCELCKQRSKLLYNVSNNVSMIEMNDLRRKAQVVEYTSDLFSSTKLNENSNDINEIEPFRNENHQLKFNSVNTQFAERCDTNSDAKNYSSDCLNRYQTNLDKEQSHKILSSSASDISSRAFDNDNKSSYQYNSSYLKKGSTSSSIQTNCKLENNHSKKRKKPEKTLTQDCEGYVGYKDIQFLTNYITGNTSESMRNTTINNNSNNSKEMNIKKKDKKEFNDNNLKKKNGLTIVNKETNEQNLTNQQSTVNQTNLTNNDLTNDKNNNLTTVAATNATNNSIPNSSNHQSSSIRNSDNSTTSSRKVSQDLSINSNNKAILTGNVVNGNNLNNQYTNNRKQTENNKRIDKNNKIVPSVNQINQSRKSSANLELNSAVKSINSSSPQQSKDEKSTANSISIVKSNNLYDDSKMIDCTVSDPEMPDQEGDFKIVKYKQLRRKKQKKGSNQEDHIKLNNNNESINSQSSNSSQNNKQTKQQQKSSASQNPATARGYESESDYCAGEGRKKGYQLKRDVLLDNSNKTKDKKKSLGSNSDSLNSSNGDTTNNSQIQTVNALPTAINQPSETLFLPPLNPSISNLNNNLSYCKISYAAITKQSKINSYSNGVQQLTNNQNSLTNSSNQETNISKKDLRKNSLSSRNSFNNASINNSSSSTNGRSKMNKLINTNEQKIESVNKLDLTKNKKIDDRKQNQQQPKKTTKLNKHESNLETEEKINTAELSNDSSRTVSIDLSETPDVSSSAKSSSLNSNHPPPVIMLDNKNTNQDTLFTFGFFDENAQFQNNVAEEQFNEQFKSINVNSVNFISNIKEPTTDLGKTNDEIYRNEDNKDEFDNELNNKSDNKLINEKNDLDKNKTTTVCISTLLNSKVTNTNSPTNSTSSNGNSNSTPSIISQGIYYCISEEDNNSNGRIESITKRVQNRTSFNEQSRSANTYANEITSYNLTKFREKITSPINVNSNQINRQKQTKPEFSRNVAYVQAVNYIRKTWEAANRSKPKYFAIY